MVSSDGGLCSATDRIWFYKCINNRKDVPSEVQPRLTYVVINIGNVVYSNVVHTMEISETNTVFRDVPLA